MENITKNENKYSLLNRSIYGVVQAARKFFVKLETYLKSMGLINCHYEQCLFRNSDMSLVVGVYVDDLLILGEPKSVS